MPHPDPERSAVVYDIWKKIDNSADPQEPPRPRRRLTWVKARSFPYFLTKAKAQAELAAALSHSDAPAGKRYKIVAHPLAVRMLELDIAQGKVAL